MVQSDSAGSSGPVSPDSEPQARGAAAGTLRLMPPRGRYLAHEAGRLAGVSGKTIGQWARRGYIRSSHSDSPPRVYSFQDVAEAMLVHELLRERVPHREVLRTIRSLRTRFGDWPLTKVTLATTPGEEADERPRMPARLLVLEDEQAYELTDPGWQLTSGLTLKRIVSDLRRGGWAVRELPEVRHIEVDPDRLSGRPTIRGRRIPVEKVAELAEIRGGTKILLEEYELSHDEIRDARRWWSTTQRYEAQAA
jgi:uncharacterized protein (DUF433 family)/DNA-binding transcriptional MerR regulator